MSDPPSFDHPSYCSFLVRLWLEPGGAETPWRGEIEHIQSGVIVAISSLEEAFTLIQQTGVEGAREEDGNPLLS